MVIIIDLVQRRVYRNKEDVALTSHEWDVLAILASSPGVVQPTEEITAAAWPEGTNYEALKVYIHRLRCLLGPDIVVSYRGRGYRLGDSVQVIQDSRTFAVQGDRFEAFLRDLAALVARHLSPPEPALPRLASNTGNILTISSE